MRGVIGPIMTTGVALVTAAVVVANPISAPHADVRVPAVMLSSGNDETGGMLDPAFLSAIAPGPSVSDSPFAVLKLLVSSLAADATSLGKNAIVDAFVAGVVAVSDPELTAATAPYAAPSVDPYPVNLPAPIAPIAPGLDMPSLNPAAPTVPTVAVDPTSAIAAAMAPAVREIVSSLVADVGYVGNGLISAAFAVGALVATEPALIVDTLSALVVGDFNGALENAVKVVVAPLGPPTILYNTLRTVIENRLTQPASNRPTSPAEHPVTPEPTTPEPADVPQVVASPAPASGVDVRQIRRNHRGAVAPTVEIASVPGAAAALGFGALRAAATVSGATPSGRGAVGAAGKAISAIGDQAGAVVHEAATAVGKIAGSGRGARVSSAADRG